MSFSDFINLFFYSTTPASVWVFVVGQDIDFGKKAVFGKTEVECFTKGRAHKTQFYIQRVAVYGVARPHLCIKIIPGCTLPIRNRQMVLEPSLIPGFDRKYLGTSCQL